ncbi:MAG: type IV secretory system conjugative DNA transfer family protein [Candidatus Dormibacteria bacterium]
MSETSYQPSGHDDASLLMIAAVGVAAFLVGLDLYAALSLSLILTHGTGALTGMPGIVDGLGHLLHGLIFHTWQPWAGYPHLTPATTPNPRMFWTLAAVVAVVGGAPAGWLAMTIQGWARPQPKARHSHGEARWATRRDLRRAVDFRSPRGLTPNGIVLGWWGRRVVQSKPEDNVLLIGVGRSGKTSTVVIPTLVGWRGAVIATSTKSELVRLTGPHRARLGRVGVFAPLESDHDWIRALGLEPVTWNPLTAITSAGTAAELADVFTGDGKPGESAHWYLSAANLLAGIFLAESGRLRAKDGDGGDLRAVLSRLNHTRLEDYPGLALSTDDPTAKELISALAATPEREAGSIISTARSCLSLWNDERVSAATIARGPQELDVRRLLADGGTLYLVAPVEEAERCRPLFSALLQSILRTATARAQASRSGVLSPRLLLALDEVANFVRIPRLASYVSTGPGQGIQALLCFQDLAQLEGGYGQTAARSVMNNCRCRVLMPGQGDLGTLEAFSRALGHTTTIYEVPSWNPDGNRSWSEQRTGSLLAAPEVLREMDEPLLIAGAAKPARLHARGWWKVRPWRQAVEYTQGQPADDGSLRQAA